MMSIPPSSALAEPAANIPELSFQLPQARPQAREAQGDVLSILLARLAQSGAGPRESDEVLRVADVLINLAAHEVRVAGRRVQLARREFELLRFFAARPGRVYTREELLVLVWNDAAPIHTRTIDTHVHRLRRKLGPRFSAALETLRKVGYKLQLPDAALSSEPSDAAT